MLKQVGLIPSGNQTNCRSTLDNTCDQFLFCSTLSLYIYSSEDYDLKKILNGHDSNILSVAWSPFDSNVIVVSHKDSMFYLWDILHQKPHFSHNVGKGFVSLSFSTIDSSTVIGM
jgi:WD40 repeat protein